MNKTQIITLVVAIVIIGAALAYSSGPTITNTINITGMTNQTENLTAQDGDMVSVLYTGKLTNGTVFDASSLHGNKPIEFVLGANMVIKGWDEGLVGMRIGEKKTMTIPPEKAYGNRSVGDVIPANSTLVFDVELVGIKRK